MSDFKDKLPDLKELSSMTNKLFKGIKNSIDEIVKDYKAKRTQPKAAPKEGPSEKKKAAPKADPSEKK